MLLARCRDIYEHSDSNHKYRLIDYDYLTDETGLNLSKILRQGIHWPLYHEYHMDDEV